MRKISRLSALCAVSAAVYLSGYLSASSQTIMAPEKKVAVAPSSTPAPSTRDRKPARVSNTAHVYLLRGLLNVFSLGMDDLAQKIQQRGVTATVHNHAEWQSLSDEIAAKYKAGNRGPIVLIGHSLGADAVMFMGEYLGNKGVPVALIVPFDGTNSFAATSNVARVMNITQRDYAYMKRGPGFRGELANIDVSRDESIGHISIDKSARLHALVVNKIISVVGGRAAPVETAARPNAVPRPRPPAPVEAVPASAPAPQDSATPQGKPANPATSGNATRAEAIAPGSAPAAAVAQPAAIETQSQVTQKPAVQ